MKNLLEQRLSRLINARQSLLLQDNRVGLEKESLRVSPSGTIAQTSHPEALGSALTHPYITTDYSEALLEFVTPPVTQLEESIHFLHRIHQFVYQQLDNELLWAASMPCVLDGDIGIPIARYGQSNIGQLKHIYRRGLAHRYGKTMQIIAGVHYNFSVAEAFWPVFQDLENDRRDQRRFIAASYFGLIRNVQRYSWLLLYLFGSSAAVCKSFLGAKTGALKEFAKGTLFEPYATSLRMSDIGYTNRKRCRLQVSYNSLDSFVAGLQNALHTVCTPYREIGVRVDGEYRQLSPHVLQIENEYYSLMRPKRPPRADERPLQALRKQGVEYVELRSNDVNIFDPCGVDATQLYFLESFLLFCLLRESLPINSTEQAILEENHLRSARRGREPGLTLRVEGRDRVLRQWGLDVCEQLRGICEVLDATVAEPYYTQALQVQVEALHDPERTPSARMLAEMRADDLDFFDFAQYYSDKHRRYFAETPLSEAERRQFLNWTEESLVQQQAIEEADTLSFDDYLRQYLATV